VRTSDKCAVPIATYEGLTGASDVHNEAATILTIIAVKAILSPTPIVQGRRNKALLPNSTKSGTFSETDL
jgi:hypothetical protein